MAACTVLGCDDDMHAKGLCNRHYIAARKGRNVGHGPAMFGVFARTECERCDREPMGGGRWCADHFVEYVREQDRLAPGRVATRGYGNPDPARTCVVDARNLKASA